MMNSHVQTSFHKHEFLCESCHVQCLSLQSNRKAAFDKTKLEFTNNNYLANRH